MSIDKVHLVGMSPKHSTHLTVTEFEGVEVEPPIEVVLEGEGATRTAITQDALAARYNEEELLKIGEGSSMLGIKRVVGEIAMNGNLDYGAAKPLCTNPVVPQGNISFSEAWDMAHDEKYAREGMKGLLEEPTEGMPMAGTHKSDAIDDLHESYLNGDNITIDFNGEPMNSREIGELGIDRAYKKYFGYDKESYKEYQRLESDAFVANYALEQFEKKLKAKQEVPKLIEQSVDLINAKDSGDWRQCLEIRATDLYHGTDSRAAIELMKAHSYGRSEADLRQMFTEQDHSGASDAMTMAIIRNFYKSGATLAGILE